ncbi:MAG: hypothetical protein GY719_32170 [bacterium]|nr:hypothetical protein [bacterium]
MTHAVSLLLVILALSVIFLAAAPAPALFDPASRFRTIVLAEADSGYILEHTIADVDEDGRFELVVSRAEWPFIPPETTGEIVVYEVGPDSTLVQELLIPLPAGRPSSSGWISPHVLDLDGDGVLDIAAWWRKNNGQGILDVAYGRVAGGYTVVSYPTPDTDSGYRMALADIDADGLADVLTTNGGFSAPGTLFVLFNSSDPADRFTTYLSYAMGSDATGVFVEDIDQDGRVDAAVTTHDTGPIGGRVLFFPGPTALDFVPGDGSRSSSIGFGDVDLDGRTDLVMNAAIPHSARDYLWIYRQTAARAFAAPVQWPTTGNRPKMPKFADFDGDGLTEMVVSVTEDRLFNFFARDASGVLDDTPLVLSTAELSAVDHGRGTNPNALTIGDLDNDGDQDIVFGLLGLVLVQNVDDLDGDGYFDYEDCDDADPTVNPGAFETCDGIDNNCDGETDEGFDEDGDGVADCFDNCPAVPNDQNDSDADGAGDACDPCPFDADDDDDGVCGDVDLCAGTSIPEAVVPSLRLGTNRWALVDGDDVFDTSNSNGSGPGLAFTITETAGCSCEQIIAAQDLGRGHVKFGCSISAIRDWFEAISNY